MKFTERQLQVLYEAQFDSRLSVRQIAAATRLKERTVRDCLDMLIEHQVFKPFVFVSPYALGLTDCCVFVRRGVISSTARKRLPERLAPLRAAGFSEARLQQLHAPIGLDIGGKAPWEVALSVIGEVTALRHARLAEEPRKATPKRATA